MANHCLGFDRVDLHSNSCKQVRDMIHGVLQRDGTGTRQPSVICIESSRQVVRGVMLDKITYDGIYNDIEDDG